MTEHMHIWERPTPDDPYNAWLWRCVCCGNLLWMQDEMPA